MGPPESPAQEHHKRRGTHKNKEGGKGEFKSKKSDDVCAMCDDGGYVLCCDGGCLRSFHVTNESGGETNCRTLGLTEKQAEEMESFICNNCKYKQHQCFTCGLLGSSDMSSGAEVFQCNKDGCGHFYHPKCVAGLAYPDSNLRAAVFEQQVAAGLNFYCPMHKCSVCKRGEKQNDEGMQFAVCRRCPTSYHRKCLPSEISFKRTKHTIQRAWKDVLPGRILIYCMSHEIDENLGTPKRNNLIFPDGTVDKDELLDCPTSELTETSPQAATRSSFNPMDSFAPKALFPFPHTGSCGWIDD